VNLGASELLFLLVFFAIGGLIGLAIGSSKGRGAAGFWLGGFLGFIGWIIVAVMSPSSEVEARRMATAIAAAQGSNASLANQGPSSRPCPYCAESIQAAAVVCRFCGRDVEPTALPPVAVGTPEQWLRDPSGRHPDRWWDGSQWTHWVRDEPGGTRSEDPPLPKSV